MRTKREKSCLNPSIKKSHPCELELERGDLSHMVWALDVMFLMSASSDMRGIRATLNYLELLVSLSLQGSIDLPEL